MIKIVNSKYLLNYTITIHYNGPDLLPCSLWINSDH